MHVKRLTPNSPDYPRQLRQLTDAPRQLFVQGEDVNVLLSRPGVAIVGSRKTSVYGVMVTRKLAEELAGAGIVIISGLALGVDSIAHQAALDAGGLTIAVLPCGPDRIYPASHRRLAQHIIDQGGAVVTEYEPGALVYPSNFIARNRITAGLSQAVVITEAAQRSGTLSTARFALEQGKELLAVPGNITSPTSVGTNTLIKTGAAPVTSAQDVLHALGLMPAVGRAGAETHHKPLPRSHDPHQQAILTLLGQGVHDGSELLVGSQLDISHFNQALTMLELSGTIRALGGNQWGLQ